MKTILGWSDGGSACEYYRLRVPLEYLATWNDYNVMIGGMFQLPAKDTLPDVVIGQRINRPEPAHLWRMLADGEFDGQRPRLIYEIDDDLFNVPPSNPVHSHFSQPEVRQTILSSMALADVITVSTQALAEEVQAQLWSWGAVVKRVVVVPNALPDIAYRHPVMKMPNDPLTVGWGGSSSHVQDFDEVTQPLARFLRRYPKGMFHAIGHLFPQVSKKVPAQQQRLTEWIRDMPSYYSALDSFDIGIAPLRPSVFNRSKSDIKFLEYAARGIPAILSPVGPYEEHINEGRALGAFGHEWQDQIRRSVRAVYGDVGTSGYPDRVIEAYRHARSRHIRYIAPLWNEVIRGE